MIELKDWQIELISIIGWLIFSYMMLVVLFYSSMLIVSFIKIKKKHHRHNLQLIEEYASVTYTRPVTIIVPAYNEEQGIIQTTRSLLSIHYPEYEIIVVNDGSTDDTLKVMIEHFQMKPTNRVVQKHLETEMVTSVLKSEVFPNLIIVNKANGGKADALNTGINYSRYPYFCSLDGDSVLENDSLLKVMQPIIKSNEKIIASGGSIRIGNGSDIQLGTVLKVELSRKPLVIMQVIEYLRAFLIGRVGLSHYNLNLIISGAFGVFSKKHCLEVGGYTKDLMGEDMELIVKLHRLIKEKKLKKRIHFVPEPVCWTEAPERIDILQKQRIRWHQGLSESLWKHRKMTLNPKYGLIGMVSFPYFWFVEFLGPVIELSGYLYMIFSLFFGDMFIELSLALFLVFILYGSIFSMLAVLLEAWSTNRYPKVKVLLRLFALSFSEIFWYRPITVVWRCIGIFRFIFKFGGWGTMERVGLGQDKDSEREK